MAIQCRTLAEWDEFHQMAGRSGWCFRGQADAEWELKTTIERVFEREGVSPDQRMDVEAELIREFKRAYHQFGVHIPGPDAPIEWLALMRHYGAPTRLLDFTYSLYVAAYFALEDANKDCAVYAINPEWAQRESVQLLQTAGKVDLKTHMSRTTPEQELEVYAAHFKPPFARSAYPGNPFRLNERLRIQKGIFLIPGDCTVSFAANLESLPGHDSSCNAEKIKIPIRMRKHALKRLFQMNVSRTSLFPGLDGYGRSLGVYHPAFDEPGTTA